MAYAYIAPFYILFAIFGLFPIVAGFGLSFLRWDGIGPMHFNGVTNYINLFKDPLFWKALSNTLLIGIIAHIPILLGGLALAYILNSKLVKGENIFKTIYFMPMVTSSVAISIIFQTMFGNNYGVINWFLSLFGGKNINWLGGDGSLIKVAVIVMFAWKWVGWNMVIYLAGMQGISGDIYEAAKIDGASTFRIYRSVMLPLCVPTLATLSITTFMESWNDYLWPLLMPTDRAKMTLPIALSTLNGQYNTEYNVLMAGSLISMIPILLLYIFAQKYFKNGLMAGGIKG